MFHMGDEVEAKTGIYERDLGLCVARPGDLGRVEYVDPEGVPTVRWNRTRRATDCIRSEIALVGGGKS